jgi:hypothetical protein
VARQGALRSQLPFIRYASHRRRWTAVTLDVSASGCVGESSTCREHENGAENNRSGKHEVSGREHCGFLSDRSVVFAARCTPKHSGPIATLEQIVRLADYSRRALLQANWSIKPL